MATDFSDTTKSTYDINDLTDLINFRDAVNAGNKFQGKTIRLNADIDLNNENWTPIGSNETNSFNGTFDGRNHTISNLKIDGGSSSNIGFFGFTQNGVIKNLTVENAIVSGRLNVGVVAGTPYTSNFYNITVTGHVEVNGMAYVGGVGGKNAYADWDNIVVDVDDTSYINANSVENGNAYRTYVGGVIGFMGEGNHTFSNISSNIDVKGSTCDVGGITGIAHYQNNFINVNCSGDVSIYNGNKEIGGIAGVWHNQDGLEVTINNCKFTGKLSAVCDGSPVDEELLKNYQICGTAYDATGTGKLLIFDGSNSKCNVYDKTGALVNTVDVSTIYINSDWGQKAFNTEVEDGKFMNLNAFASFTEALQVAAIASDKLVIAKDMSETTSKVFTVTLQKALTITGGSITFGENSKYNITFASDVESADLKFEGFQWNSLNKGTLVFEKGINAVVDKNSNIEIYTGKVEVGGAIKIDNGGKFTCDKEAFNVYGTMIFEGAEDFVAANEPAADALRRHIKYTTVTGKAEASNSYLTFLDRVTVSGEGSFAVDNTRMEIGKTLDNSWFSNPVGNGVGRLLLKDAAKFTISDGSLLKVSGGLMKGSYGMTVAKDATFTIGLGADGEKSSYVEIAAGVENQGTINLNNGTFKIGTEFYDTTSQIPALDLNNTGTINVNGGTQSAAAVTNNGTFTVSGKSTINGGTVDDVVQAANFTGTGVAYLTGAELDANTNITGTGVFKAVSGNNTITDSKLTVQALHVGDKSESSYMDKTNGSSVTVGGSAFVDVNGTDDDGSFGGWIGTRWRDTNEYSDFAETNTARYKLKVTENAIAVFDYLHVAADGELYVDSKNTTYNPEADSNSYDYAFYTNRLLVNGKADFVDTAVRLLSLHVSNDNPMTGDAAGELTLSGTKMNVMYYDGKGTSISVCNNGIFNITGASEVTLHGCMNVSENATVNLTGSTFNLLNATYGNNTVYGDITNAGTITIDGTSQLKANSYTGTGTITIDAADFSGYKKVIDLNGTESLKDKVTFINKADDVTAIYGADGDVTLTDADMSTIYVDASYTGETGKYLDDGKYAGVNAFADINAATKIASAAGSKLVIAEGTVADAKTLWMNNDVYDKGTEGYDYVLDADKTFDVEVNGTLIGTQVIVNSAKMDVAATGKVFTSGDDKNFRVFNSEVTFQGSRTAGDIIANDEVFTKGFWGGLFSETEYNDKIQGTAGLMKIDAGSTVKFNDTFFLIDCGRLEIGQYWSMKDTERAASAVILDNTQLLFGNRGSYGDSSIVIDNNSTFSVTNGSYVAIAQDAKLGITINTGSEMNISGSTLSADTVTNAGTITIDGTSQLKANSYTGNGTITIDAADFSGYKKVIDLNGTESLKDKVTFINKADDVTAIYGADGDVTLTDADMSTIYVDAAVKDKAVGTYLGDGKYAGINAFADVAKAEAALTADTSEIKIAAGTYSADSYVSFEKAGTTSIAVDGKAILSSGHWLFGTNAYQGSIYNISGDFVAENGMVWFLGDTKGTVMNFNGSTLSSGNTTFRGGKVSIAENSSVTVKADASNWSQMMIYADVTCYGSVEVDIVNQMGAAFLVGTDAYKDTKGYLYSVFTLSGKNASLTSNQSISDGETTCNIKVAGQGKLVVEDGATVNTQGHIIINAQDANAKDAEGNAYGGTLSVNGGNINAAYIINNGTFTVSGESMLDIASLDSEKQALVFDSADLTASSISGKTAYINVKGDNTYDGTMNVCWLNVGYTEDEVVYAGSLSFSKDSSIKSDVLLIGENSSLTYGSEKETFANAFNITELYAGEGSTLTIQNVGATSKIPVLFAQGNVVIDNADINGNDLVLGNSQGNASLKIKDSTVTLGGASNAVVILGDAVGGELTLENSNVTVKQIGPGSSWDDTIQDVLTIGYKDGAATVNINENSTLDIKYGAAINANSKVNVNGGTFIVANTVTNNGTFTVSGESTLKIGSFTGEITLADDAVISSSSKITGTGTINVLDDATIYWNSVSDVAITVGDNLEFAGIEFSDGAVIYDGTVTLNEGADLVINGSSVLWNDNKTAGTVLDTATNKIYDITVGTENITVSETEDVYENDLSMTLTGITQGDGYNFTVDAKADGGKDVYTWSVAVKDLATGTTTTYDSLTFELANTISKADVTVTVTDAYGMQVSELKQLIVKDVTAPEFAVSADTVTPAKSAAVTFSGIADNFGADAVKIQYNNNGTWEEVSEFVVNANGTYEFRAIDAAGNASATQSLKFENIDNEAPVLIVKAPEGWSNTDVKPEVTVTDANSATVWFAKEGGEFAEYTADSVISESGTYVFYAVDSLGNKSAEQGVAIKIDKVAPTMEIAADVTAPTNGNVTLSATVSDGKVEYFNGTDWVEGSSFAATENGTYQFRVTDAAGNVTAKDFVVENIDREAPSMEIAADVTTLTNGNVTLTAAVSDGKVEYFNGTEWVEGSSFAATENGTYQFRVTDAAGNVTAKDFVVENIDTAAPVIENAAVKVDNGNIVLTWSAADALSGLDKVTVAVNGAEAVEVTGNEFIFTPETYGEFNFVLTATDKAGNIITAEKSITTAEKVTDKVTVSDKTTAEDLENLKDSYVVMDSGKSDIKVQGGTADAPLKVEVQGFDKAGDKDDSSNVNHITVGNNTLLNVHDNIANLGNVKVGNNASLQVLVSNQGETLAGIDKKQTIKTGNNSEIVVHGDLELGKGNDQIKIGQNSVLAADNIVLGEGNNKIDIGKNSVAKTEDITLKDGKNQIKVGSDATFKAGNINYGTGNAKLSIGKDADVTAGDINLGEGKNQIKIGNEADVTAGNITAGSANDKLTVGKDADVFFAEIDLGAGNDTFNIGADSDVHTGNILTGAGNDKLVIGKDAYLHAEGMVLDMGAGKDTLDIKKNGQLFVDSLAGIETIKAAKGAELHITSQIDLEGINGSWKNLEIFHELDDIADFEDGLLYGNETDLISFDEAQTATFAGDISGLNVEFSNDGIIWKDLAIGTEVTFTQLRVSAEGLKADEKKEYSLTKATLA